MIALIVGENITTLIIGINKIRNLMNAFAGSATK